VVIYLMAMFCKINVNKETSEYPFVSVIISAFNEDKHIESKILNTLAQDYPKDKMEILINRMGPSTNRGSRKNIHILG
jgi:cellulose synthase/poly-beta-1,6-N-acetylglucosamine synthase-like glycosyltransferase